jgi:hypothetical protein
VVEFAFDYGEFNTQFPAFAIHPNNSLFLLFEATRGLKGQSNYFWNDKYSLAEAGSPYFAQGAKPVSHPQNIYELDTLLGHFSTNAVLTPEPATLAIWSLMSLMGVGAGYRCRRRRNG